MSKFFQPVHGGVIIGHFSISLGLSDVHGWLEKGLILAYSQMFQHKYFRIYQISNNICWFSIMDEYPFIMR